jgi:16S rRNA (guanine(966)-N(2))-methyltransferase RsmD
MVRAALFSMLGDAVPDRPFFDLFAGTGAVGMEALSRGAVPVVFVERNLRAADAIHQHVRTFQVANHARIVRADVYRWLERWQPGDQPLNVFLGPPFPDFSDRLDALTGAIADLQIKLPAHSVLVLQSEDHFDLAMLPDAARWERRKYGRNLLLLWVKEPTNQAATE